MKDVLFCTPLWPKIQLLFTFEDTIHVTRKSLGPSYHKDIEIYPILFEQILAQDIMNWSSSHAMFLQYVYGLLLCVPSKGGSLTGHWIAP